MIINMFPSSTGSKFTIFKDIIDPVSTSTFHDITIQTRPTPIKPLKKALKLFPGRKKAIVAAHSIADHQGANSAIAYENTEISMSLNKNIISSLVEAFV